MKDKRFLVIPAALTLLAGLYILNKQADGLTATERTEVSMRAKNFVRRLNRRELDTCYKAFSPTMSGKTSIERFHAIFDPILEYLGEFVEFRGGSVSKKTYTSGTIYYTCNLKCDFENGRALFTIIFDKDMEIAELFVK
ncbi:MAG: DUF3887 domain-containing protein [Eubacterium sp.]|nr:DUF3887 domain-containing protein [Eubacterium sp.]